MKSKIADFLINNGLYGEGFEIFEEDYEELKSFLEGSYKIDVYCPSCDADRIFTAQSEPKRKSISSPQKINIFEEQEKALIGAEEVRAYQRKVAFNTLIRSHKNIVKNFYCSKEESHTLIFCCSLSDNFIIKYGQYPSLAELNKNTSRKYRKILGKKYSDYNKGLGLYAHGVGAGSLIYLRRIFEDLIEEAHKQAMHESGWDEGIYNQSRMNEKIQILKNFLPEYLVLNRGIYGILSKGIHELDEETCKDIFPIMKAGIEFILDEKIERQEREKRKKETEGLIKKLTHKFNN